MRALYFDCFAGVSGDMIIGALLDLGVDLEELKRQLSSLALGGYEIRAERVKRSNIAATKFDVVVDESHQPARTLSDIRILIEGSSISPAAKALSIRVFEKLAQAEARVHASTPDRVHFHEVGAVDSIIDIVGAIVGFELLGVKRFLSSPLRVGRGSVKAAHGVMPIPAPGTAELLRGIPVYAGELEGEFVTPTGAAILATVSESFSTLPDVVMERVGYGAGSRNPEGFPNALRLIVGEFREAGSPLEAPESVVVIETNIDDMNPQAYGYVMERAFVLGALDVFTTPAQMKKDRPGTLLTLLCGAGEQEALIEMLLTETTTLGVRYYEAKRRILSRSVEEVETAYGRVRIKVARAGARTLHFQAEYADCARLAEQSRAPLLEVQAAALAAYREKRAAQRES
jgi:uncharacterized protein (TIGR00299 family) protein